MADRIFLNLTNHQLSDEQLKILKELGFDIYEKQVVFSEETISKLQQSPDNLEELINLAKYVSNKLKDFIDDLKTHHKLSDFWIHLPIGSPLFQSLLFTNLVETFENHPEVRLVYSHSKRVVEENPETGEKKSVFKFEKFLIVNPKNIKEVANA